MPDKAKQKTQITWKCFLLGSVVQAQTLKETLIVWKNRE